MKNKEFLEWAGCGIATIFTAVQTQEVFQIISLILTCVATLLTIAYNIYKWVKNAMKDKKLDENEIKEGIDLINDSIDKIEALSNNDKGENK